MPSYVNIARHYGVVNVIKNQNGDSMMPNLGSSILTLAIKAGCVRIIHIYKDLFL